LDDNGSDDNSEGNDGNKGDSDDEVDDNNVDRTDDNNQVRSRVEIEVEVVQAPDSYDISFLCELILYYSSSERRALVHINWALLDLCAIRKHQ
jgi:hypothetical protein